MEIVSLGDSALIVRVRDQFEEAPEETLDEVLRTFQRIRNAAIPGVIELAPAYTSVSVLFDPITVTEALDTSDDVLVRSGKRPACAFARRRSRALSRNHARGV